MPSIDLARLKIQAFNLANLFDQPEAFISLLKDTLSSYTNRTKRPSKSRLRTSLQSYQTPRAILRKIRSELAPLVTNQPEQAFALIHVLWQAGILETRLLAATLLGYIPPESALSLLSHIPDWLHETRDVDIQEAILVESLAGVRHNNREAFLSLLETWLQDKDPKVETWGLRAMLPLLNEPGFFNLPVIFRLLSPTIENISSGIQMDLVGCLHVLDSLSPTETSQFLQNILARSKNPQLFRIMRRIQTTLSRQLQADLREFLKNDPFI